MYSRQVLTLNQLLHIADILFEQGTVIISALHKLMLKGLLGGPSLLRVFDQDFGDKVSESGGPLRIFQLRGIFLDYFQ